MARFRLLLGVLLRIRIWLDPLSPSGVKELSIQSRRSPARMRYRRPTFLAWQCGGQVEVGVVSVDALRGSIRERVLREAVAV
jgi:hypothetical protein